MDGTPENKPVTNPDPYESQRPTEYEETVISPDPKTGEGDLGSSVEERRLTGMNIETEFDDSQPQGIGTGTTLPPEDGMTEEIELSPEEQLAELLDTPANIKALIQNYTQIDNKLDTFFFETVDGMFEYLLFLILYKHLSIFGFYRDPKPKPPTTEMDITTVQTTPETGIPSSDSGVAPSSETGIPSSDSDEVATPVVGPDGLRSGGAPPNLTNNLTNEKFTSIQLIKLFKELNHDFKGVGKTLDYMQDIRDFCFEYIEDNTENPGENLERLYDSMMNGTTDEWNFYTSILEYYCEELGKFNDLTMIRYKSRTDKESGKKDYIIRDINSYPSGEDSYSKLFVEEDFLYRFQDNGTTNGLLSKLVDREPNLDNYIKVIQNAPSLIDPATVSPINMAKFYPVQVQGDHDLFSEFQKCQDLNNFLIPNEIIQNIQNIMKDGIKKFFSYFGVKEIEIEYVEFVVFQDRRPIDDNPIQLENYTDWLSKLNDGIIAAENPNCPFFYQGIRIIHNQSEPLELHVGDIAIPNIASLINSGYYLNPEIESYGTPVTIIIYQETRDSWNRVVNFAKFIRERSIHKTYKKDDFLRFIIISMKSFGDSFQVYYSTAIQQQQWEYSDISSKTYLSSSDKNTGAEKMLYDSRFLLNGCGIRPYQGLKDRFPDFFNVELTGNELNYNGDVGSKHTTTQYEYGYSKALVTNIKSGGKDYNRYIKILCNQIVGIVNNIFPNNLEAPAGQSDTNAPSGDVVVMEDTNASQEYQLRIDKLLKELFGEDFFILDGDVPVENNEENIGQTVDVSTEERTPDKFLINFENIRKGCLDPIELTHIELRQKPFIVDNASAIADVATSNQARVTADEVSNTVDVVTPRSKSPFTTDDSNTTTSNKKIKTNPVKVKEISKKLEQIYNRLKIYQETNNALNNKIETFLNDFQLQQEYLTKLIDLKRSPTTNQLDTLLNKLNKDPTGNFLETDLNKLVASATGIPNEPVVQSNTFTRRIADFISTIKDKVTEKKNNLKIFIEKIKTSGSVRTSERTAPSNPANAIKRGLYGLMDLLNKTTATMPTGGKNRTIKNRHAYMKKYTRKHGHSTNKRKTRHASQEKRKHKTQRKYM